MAIPILYWMAGGGLAGLALKQRQDGIEAGEPPRRVSRRKQFGIKSLNLSGSGAEPTEPEPEPLKTGPLPAAALAAWNSKKHGKGNRRSAYGPDNDIHKPESWLRYATYSKNWDKKLEKMRIYSNPPGTLYVKSKSKVRNLCWMMCCPPKLYPGYGKAKRRNVRWSAMKLWLSPKADWKTFTGGMKTSIKNIPAVLKGALVVVTAIVTLGASLLVKGDKKVDNVHDAIAGALEAIGDTAGSVKKRKAAARAVFNIVCQVYIERVMDANPHAVKNGKLDIGKHYKANPKTYEDLRSPGGSRPLLFIPAQGVIET